jgi:hypothetical protein
MHRQLRRPRRRVGFLQRMETGNEVWYAGVGCQSGELMQLGIAEIWAALLSPPILGILAGVGAVLGVVNTTWNLWRLYMDRVFLVVAVDWDWSERDPDDTSSPRVTIRNKGHRPAYVTAVELVERGGNRHLLRRFDNQKVEPGAIFIFRPDWSEPTEDDPEFRSDWRGLRVAIEEGSGKRWFSPPATKKPSWYVVRSPFNPALWEGVSERQGPA